MALVNNCGQRDGLFQAVAPAGIPDLVWLRHTGAVINGLIGHFAQARDRHGDIHWARFRDAHGRAFNGGLEVGAGVHAGQIAIGVERQISNRVGVADTFQSRNDFLAGHAGFQAQLRIPAELPRLVGIRPARLQLAKSVQFLDDLAGVGVIAVHLARETLAVFFLVEVNLALLEEFIKLVERNAVGHGLGEEIVFFHFRQQFAPGAVGYLEGA